MEMDRQELVVKERIDQKTIEDFLFSTGTQLNDQQKKLFFALAIRNQLDPFKREIHAIPYKNNTTGKSELSVVTGYEVYLKRAERSGKLNGWKCTTVGEGEKMKAIITINRKDWNEPFIHEVKFSEYNQRRNLWISKPETMLKKVAMAQGFRLAFPEEIGGMPYTADEIDTEGIIEVSPTPPELPKVTKPPEEKPKTKNFDFLKSMSEAKKVLGKDAYYAVLTGEFEFLHANEVTDPEDQKNIYEEMKKAYNEKVKNEKTAS